MQHEEREPATRDRRGQDGSGKDASDDRVPGRAQRPGGGADVDIGFGATKNAELAKFLPVEKNHSGARHVTVLRLAPAQLPDLQPGDTLYAPTEVQVTTAADIGQGGPAYDPKVTARLTLTDGKDDTVIKTITKTVKRTLHHNIFVFDREATSLKITSKNLPKNKQAAHLELAMWASHPRSREGKNDKVLIGANDGDWLKDHKPLQQDRARISAVRERDVGPGDRHPDTTGGGGDLPLPTNANPKLVYSLPLNPNGQVLPVGERYYVEARVVGAVDSRAKLGTKMFITHDPNATTGNGIKNTAPSEIAEHHGVNLMPNDADPITRVAVFRVKDAIHDKVYINLVADSEVPGGELPGRPANPVVKRSKGSLRITRYDP